MNIKHVRNLALLLSLMTVVYACSSSKSTVVVVEETPATEQTPQPDSVDEQFTEITIGLIDSVSNFDPLFAENLSTQRTLSLIYEGLYTLDRQGNPVPAIASEVEISDDSLQYVFTLDENKYFHNSSVFTAGVGRRVLASDVKQAFERTAKNNVPGNAAQLLMGINGYENFFLEQRSVYDAGKRVLDGVGGIQVLNRQTVAIILTEKDPDFLKKLASPYLFVYPQEAINNSNRPLVNNPVGTGPYFLNRVQNNGQIVLSRDERRTNGEPELTLINRINLVHFADETQLFEQFTAGQIDWIPEIGPAISEQVLDDDGELQAAYEGNQESYFSLAENNANRVVAFYLNERATVNQDWLINRLAYLTDEDFGIRGAVTLNVDDFEIIEEAEPQEQYYTTFTEDSYARQLLTELHNIIFIPQSSLVLFDIRVPTNQTSIYSENSSSWNEMLEPLDDSYFLRVDTKILGLYQDYVTGIESTTVPWLLHIDEIEVQNSQSTVQ
ncbi:ABC transporter substrate-binding protein [Rhodohalobacter sp. 614A]|uniref:ABC transporter substrate-binding protein n=1 Tax=Rhodohalobacter sp. 614A TaxID=2908649 RepID=UPI001F38EA49|nr:ABC transporter substrate-binding protein [Rhodohalobacter sp. 614A]